MGRPIRLQRIRIAALGMETDWNRAHITEMRPFVGPPLSSEEFASLQELRKGVMQSAIPAEHEEKLIKLGYTKKLPDGLRLTNIGRMRLAAGQ